MKVPCIIAAATLALVLPGCGQPAAGGNAAASAPARQVDPAREAMRRVLVADAQAGEANRTWPDVYAAMERIDLSGTPADFRRAYEVHLGAWQEAADFSRRLDRMDEMPDGSSAEIDARHRALQDGISRTWEEVRRVALRYDLQVPGTSRGRATDEDEAPPRPRAVPSR